MDPESVANSKLGESHEEQKTIGHLRDDVDKRSLNADNEPLPTEERNKLQPIAEKDIASAKVKGSLKMNTQANSLAETKAGDTMTDPPKTQA